MSGLSRGSAHASRPSALRHHGGVAAVSQSPAWLGLSVNRSCTAPNRANPSPIRHFLSRPCAVDKETRTPASRSFFLAAAKMADIQVRARDRRRVAGALPGPQGRVLESGTPRLIWVVNSGALDFPGISSGRGRVSFVI